MALLVTKGLNVLQRKDEDVLSMNLSEKFRAGSKGTRILIRRPIAVKTARARVEFVVCAVGTIVIQQIAIP